MYDIASKAHPAAEKRLVIGLSANLPGMGVAVFFEKKENSLVYQATAKHHQLT